MGGAAAAAAAGGSAVSAAPETPPSLAKSLKDFEMELLNLRGLHTTMTIAIPKFEELASLAPQFRDIHSQMNRKILQMEDVLGAIETRLIRGLSSDEDGN